MASEAEGTEKILEDLEKVAFQRANDRALASMWNLNIVVFLFLVLILIIILVTYTKMGIEVVGTVGIFGLAGAWYAGFRRGRHLRRQFLDEEMLNVKQELKKLEEEPEEETIEDKVRKALHDRWR